MNRKLEKKSLLTEILGSEIVTPVESNFRRGSQQDILAIVSDELYDGLTNFFGNSSPFFQTSLPLEKIIRYKDGRFSSIEKSVRGGFGQHQGFDIINTLDLASGIIYHVIPRLNRRLVEIYSDLINQNNYLLNQLQNSSTLPEISRLKSIQEFIGEVSREIEEISQSPNLSTATLVNLQQRRIDLKEIFHTFFLN